VCVLILKKRHNLSRSLCAGDVSPPKNDDQGGVSRGGVQPAARGPVAAPLAAPAVAPGSAPDPPLPTPPESEGRVDDVRTRSLPPDPVRVAFGSQTPPPPPRLPAAAAAARPRRRLHPRRLLPGPPPRGLPPTPRQPLQLLLQPTLPQPPLQRLGRPSGVLRRAPACRSTPFR